MGDPAIFRDRTLLRNRTFYIVSVILVSSCVEYALICTV